MRKRWIIASLAVVISLNGCSSASLNEKSRPNVFAENYKIVSVETPTRVVGRKGLRRQVIDMAYFVPNTTSCDEAPESCIALEAEVLSKDVWVQREYDRYGVPMHTLWRADDSLDTSTTQSINIELIMGLYPDAVVDNRKLPNGKSKLVSLANEIGRERARISGIRETLPEWQKDNIEDADRIDENKGDTWLVK